MHVQIAEFALRTERDVLWAAQRARLLGSLAGLSVKRRGLLGKAVAEIARNAVQHGGGGTVTFALAGEASRSVEVVIRDQGPGLDRLQRSLASPNPTAIPPTAIPPTAIPPTATPAAAESENGATGDAATAPGLTRARRHVDECRITSTDRGTEVALRQSLPADGQLLEEAEVARWSTVLATRSTQVALWQSQSRIGQLARNVRDAEQRGTDLQRELQQLRSLNATLELLALVASKTVNAVAILNASGVIEWVNDGFERMTGFASGDVRGASFAEFFAISSEREPADAAAVSEANQVVADLKEAFRSGHGINHDVRHLRRDGQVYWASLSVTPVFDDAGRTTRWIGIANDVTRRREAQEELRKARDLAESANRAKSMFLANVSHELRTPMNAIIGMTDLALDTPLDEEQREYLTTAKDSAEALLCLLNDLLDLSKIEAGKLQLDRGPFELAESLRRTVKPFQLQARRKGLQFRLRIGPDVPPFLVGDDQRLAQILVNLVGNAIKFTEQGEIDVHVERQWQSGDDVGLKLTVADSGIGISGDKLQSIFEAFAQADSTTSRRFGGTGLGLTICAHLAELMGGRVWAESAVGEGSQFHVTVRLAVGEEVATPTDAAAPARASSTRPLQVLVADDNPANRVLVSRILSKRGHSVTTVEDGDEALRCIESNQFDVALFDVQMPRLDGFQATARLREREKQPGSRLPVVAMTAYAMKGDRQRCLAAGMDAYIAKPIRAPELQSVVEQIVSGTLSDSYTDSNNGAVEETFDFRGALTRLEDDVEIFCEQAELFLRDSPLLATKIRTAVSVGDGEALALAAHRLRGFAACFDAAEVVDTAARLEQMGLDRNLVEGETACAELEQAIALLRRALQRFIEQHRPGETHG